ncbi:hypothetical protein NML03_27415 [Klebsiella pneumoniae]|uniref:hypothetical protein n=6 Tax=Klebsiella pneumoniae TaxID=573 RepID=UPI001CF380D1|nr:hypothetical protein [Klebsiella pneumoniae]MCL0109919.1 hypothetical protein [Klebsiella pneumoniae]MCL0156854.1 hypothetical protein [Klebsiella pneumoniae]MCL0175034.1 hypothetical protein [Klebsiella pneumoniae]MCL0192472.1 hypothetical protein [Klebsiella pneumoniae]MCL0264095.1 hypothetical protein [Klebsiella pneumoniae]
MAFDPPLGSTSPAVLLDNAKRLDELTNGPAATVPDRAGEPLDSWRKMQEDNAALVDETRQNLIPLSRQYMTLAAAQADIANIPEGSTTYYRSPDESALAIEVMNVGGTLEPTGRKMISAEYVDALRVLITDEVAKIMASGAAITSDAYPDIAELILDSMGNSTYQRYADGTSRFPALMVGDSVEFVQIAGGLICQARGTNVEVFRIMSSGSFVYGDLISWVSDDESLSEYTEVHMDGQGRIYRRVLRDGTVEQVGEGGASGDEASNYPMVASVNGNIISVQNDVITQVTNDSGVSNIAPVAYKNFLRYLSDGSGNYKNYRATYDGKFKVREGNKKLIHVLLTGQSLAAGGSTISQSPVTTVAEADYGVICFSTGPKVDFKYDTLNDALLESVIPCRENVGTRPGQESPSSGVAKAILDATGETVLISDACSSGTDIAGISLGTATFSGGTKMIQAAVAIADKLGMDYVPVLILIHGNQNASAGTSIASYRSAMESLRASYENIINTETNGSLSLNMFIGQLSNIVPYGGTAGVTKTNTMAIAQYQEARDNEFIHLASAQYARPYSDGEHLTSAGYRTEGEVIGTVIGNWINDNTKSSLVPVESGVVQSGNTITIPVAGCVGNLVIDTTRVADPGNYGFLITGGTIASVTVEGADDTARIVITKTDSTATTRISYAETGIAGQSPGALTGSRGCIHDSQSGTSLAGLPLYNDLAVFAFQL